MKSIKLILLLILMAGSVPASGINFSQYRAIKASTNSSDKLALEYFISGVGSGFFASNLILRYEGNERLYCQPEKLILKSVNYMEILENSAEKLKATKVDYRKAPVDLLLLEGLRDKYPCK